MSLHKKAREILEVSFEVLSADWPMTVRQVYYQLVSRQVIENNRGQYQKVSKLLVNARRDGSIPWEWIEDRLRRPRKVAMWQDLADYRGAVLASYRRNVWATQPGYVEAWLEKDALSGIFEDILRPYGVTLSVGRGFDGWSSIHNAALRLRDIPDAAIVYFGDFDPSGEDMARSLRERLADQGATPEIIKCALTFEDIERYNLPPDFAKTTDTRTKAFVAKYGNVSVELDALPGNVLRDRLRQEVEARMDLDALALCHQREREAIERLTRIFAAAEVDP